MSTLIQSFQKKSPFLNHAVNSYSFCRVGCSMYRGGGTRDSTATYTAQKNKRSWCFRKSVNDLSVTCQYQGVCIESLCQRPVNIDPSRSTKSTKKALSKQTKSFSHTLQFHTHTPPFPLPSPSYTKRYFYPLLFSTFILSSFNKK